MTKFAKALRQAAQDAALGKTELAIDQAAGPLPAPPAPSSVPEIADDHLVSLLTPAAFEAEQYRALRHSVEQMQTAAGVKIVAVSSPAVGDGKTITAINLAGALAQSPEAKVLLVDADLRRPAIGSLLGHDHGMPGLINAILDPTFTLEQVLQVRPQFNLSFIHAGQGVPSSPYELLKSTRLRELLDEARRRFDYVVIDTPPLVAVQDCRLIAGWVDGFLVVVTAHRSPRRLLEEALGVVEPAKIFGLVYNGDDDSRQGGYHRYAGGYVDARAARPPRRGAAWRRRGNAH